MSQQTTPENLLITGITGYIGFQTLTTALQRGHHVRGIIRKKSNIDEVTSKSSLIAQAHREKQLEFAVVPDFLKPGAMEGVLQGITSIIHLASPMAVETDDFEAGVVEPAVKMVTSVLEAALGVASIRRVVVTSSCVTLIPFEWNMNPDSERLYNAGDVNDNPSRPFSSPMEAYWASKALARLATRSFISTHNPHFDYINFLPSVVIGPDERIPRNGSTASLLQGTRAAVMAPALTSALNSPFPYVGVPVHVADVARAHVDAVEGRIPGNAEYILSSDTPEGVEWDRDVRAVARKYFGEEVEKGLLSLDGSLTSIKWRLDGGETERVFGWEFRGFEETVRGMMGQYLELRENEV